MRLVAEGVAGVRLLELGHRADVARLDLRHRGLRLALQQLEVAHALGHVTRRVVHGAVGLEGAGVDAEERDPAGVGVGDGLEDEGGEGRVGGRLRAVGAFLTGSVPSTSPRSTGEGRRSTMASSSGWTPTLRRRRREARGRCGPRSTAWRSPRTRSSWASVPFSKNSSIRSSLFSATSSTSFSRQAAAHLLDVRRARRPPRTCRSGRRGTCPPCSSTRSATPPKPFSSPRGMARGNTARPKAFCSDSMVRPKEARSRSMRFTTMRRGMP